MNIQEALSQLVDGKNLDGEQMKAVMHQVMGGEATAAQIGALLMGLRMKGETIDEVAAAVEVMRELALPVQINAENLVDIVGTGGDGANLFNVSTASSFITAAAGAHVAKHGNRGVSSSSGASDLLSELGLPLDLSPEQISRCVEQVGMGFMFAPVHHSAMKHAVGPRKEMGMRTLFNILGPMTNPAGVKRQLIGVFSADFAPQMAEVLQRLGSEHVLLVHSEDGLDEISIAAPTQVVELKNGEITHYTINPEDFGVATQSLDGLIVDGPAQSADLIRQAFSGKAPKAAEVLALNAGAAIYVSGVASSIKEGVAIAEDVLASGAAMEKLKELMQFAQLAQDNG
jgi:anthranilate phosphoribosyltransferase